MNPLFKLVISSIFLAGLALGVSSCVTEGYVAGGTGVYYGSGDPWFENDQPWVYGRPRAFIGVDVHPERRDYRAGRGDVHVQRREDRGERERR